MAIRNITCFSKPVLPFCRISPDTDKVHDHSYERRRHTQIKDNIARRDVAVNKSKIKPESDHYSYGQPAKRNKNTLGNPF